ncbi:hypothetical protein DM01DRAFT_1334850 [Hesseltinella vesiculosa]|uniref:C2H2-type domain-containing protein n=1 Tax=Hesseltinella vesiculosa TaxID=101127 RepID=A0A1X2GLF4_9FUNG|nr:hypothetical protein DM01DRAFT_1334850 [Hesseltinella vesiculosa]
MPPPTPVFIAHCCFKSSNCKRRYNSSQNLRRHLILAHQFEFPERIDKPRMRNNASYLYLAEPSAPLDQAVSIHFGCPVCTDHFSELTSLEAHYTTNHNEHLPGQQSEQGQSRSSTGISSVSVDDNDSNSASYALGRRR